VYSSSVNGLLHHGDLHKPKAGTFLLSSTQLLDILKSFDYYLSCDIEKTK